MMIPDYGHTHPMRSKGIAKKHVQRNMVEKPFKLVSALLALEQEAVLLHHTTLYQNKQKNPCPVS